MIRALWSIFYPLALAWYGCSSPQDNSSETLGNIPAKAIKKMSPPTNNQVVITCQKAESPQGYVEGREWQLLLHQQLDKTYTAYVKIPSPKDPSNPTVKVYRKIVNYEFLDTDQHSHLFNRRFTSFSNGVLASFSFVFLAPDRLVNAQGARYNGELFESAASGHPILPLDVICTANTKVAEAAPRIETRLTAMVPGDSGKGGRHLRALPFSVDMVTQIKGRDVILSTTKFDPHGESPKNAPVFNQDGHFVGFVREYDPARPLSIEVISVTDQKMWEEMLDDNLNWTTQKVTPARTQGISPRLGHIICHFLLHGLDAPGSHKIPKGWEEEWGEIVVQAKKLSPSCQGTSRPGTVVY